MVRQYTKLMTADVYIALGQGLGRCGYWKKMKWLPVKCTGHIGPVFHADTSGVHLYMCKMLSFYDQTCGWEDCPRTRKTPMPMMATMDSSRLHRFFGIYA